MPFAFVVCPSQLHHRVRRRFRVKLDVNVPIFDVIGRMHNRNDATDVGDRAAGLEIAHHVGEILGLIKSIFLKRFERRDVFLVDPETEVRLAHVNVDLRKLAKSRLVYEAL